MKIFRIVSIIFCLFALTVSQFAPVQALQNEDTQLTTFSIESKKKVLIIASDLTADRDRSYRCEFDLTGKRKAKTVSIDLISELPFGFFITEHTDRKLVIESLRVPIVTQDFVVTLYGVANKKKITTSFNIILSDVPGFKIISEPPSREIKQMGETFYTLTIQPSGGFNGKVFLSGTVPFSNIFGRFKDNKSIISPGEETIVLVTLIGPLAQGEFNINIFGRDEKGNITASTACKLKVIEPPKN